MKIKRQDQVLVITGKDKGRTGTVTRVLPKLNAVIVDGINVVKRHTKPSNKIPQGGILEINKPIASSKVMVIDPSTGKPSRVGYKITKDGTKDRVFRPSRYSKPKKAEKPAAKAGEKSADSKKEKKA